MESNKVFHFVDFLINEQAIIELDKETSAEELKGGEVKSDEGQTEETGKFNVGDTVVYLRKSADIKDYDESKKLKDLEDDGVVGVKKIERIEGDNYFFKNKSGKEFSTPKEKILKKVESGEEIAKNESLSKKVIKFSSFIK